MKTLAMKTITVLTAVLMLTGTGYAKKSTYEVIDVKNGGGVVGTVHYKGTVPAPIMEDLNKGKNSEFCITHPDTQEGGVRPRHKVMVKDGKLINAVVFIENIEKGKDWSAEPTKFDFKNCDIFPKISVVRTLTFPRYNITMKNTMACPNIVKNVTWAGVIKLRTKIVLKTTPIATNILEINIKCIPRSL